MLRRGLTTLLVACTGCVRTSAAPVQHVDSARAAHTAPAPVVVVEFFDYGCHYCEAFNRTVLPAIQRDFIVSGRVRWQLVPFGSAQAPYAGAAATAVECAAQQEHRWPMHERLFARRPEWIPAPDPAPRFAAYARELGLDEARFAACYRDPRTAAWVAKLRHMARQLDVRIAPTFLVNGRRIEGAVSLDDFRSALIASSRAD